ncbi:MAG: hypothetical protein ABI824_01685 [Acidobacteriota bacterium]
MFGKSWVVALVGAAMLTATALAGTFGQVVSIGGAASDVALDEARGVLYIANFTANRIEVMSLATNKIQTSINVAAQPSSISLSPDGTWLLVANYGAVAAPGTASNRLTLINLRANNAKQTFALADAPLGLAFGIDNRALIVTTKDFILFDPVTGATQLLTSIQAQAANTIPQPAQSFPPNIVAASVAASADGTVIYGFGDTLLFRYFVQTRGLSSTLYSASPKLAPRAVSVADDGSYAAMGWTMVDRQGNFYAEFDQPSGILNKGGHGVDSKRGLVYSEVPKLDTDPAMLRIYDADNLTMREQLQLPEHMAGRAVMGSNGNNLYAVSDSGVLVLPVGNLNSIPRLQASVEDLVFRGNFCDRSTATQTFVLSDPGGARVPFTITSGNAGVRVSPSSGVTPAVITVSVDPNAFAAQQGTVAVSLTITSSTAVNLVTPLRVLVNSQAPDQRGTFTNIPGTLVDLIADPGKDQYYVLRQDKNQVLVFDGSNNTVKATLRTCTKPMSMAVTFDRAYLLVGCDNSHVINVFTTDTLQAQAPIRAPSSYVQSLATSAKAILAVMRDGGGGPPRIERIDLASGQSLIPPRLGVYKNEVPLHSVMASAPNGASIMVASDDGSVMLYDANVDDFTISRKDYLNLSGPFAASAFGQYVAGNHIMDSSLVQTGTVQTTATTPSGFAFLDQGGISFSADSTSSSGVISRVDATGLASRPTRTVEAPLLPVANVTPFTRTLAPLYSRNVIIGLTASGITVFPAGYDAAVASPNISRVVSAADGVSSVAPGGLFTIFGTNLSPTNQATLQIPLPTALGNSCMTVNGQPVPILFVSPSQINAQMPFQAVGNTTLIIHTPGGVSDNYNLTVQTNAPAVFFADVAGPGTTFPTVVRAANNLMATDSNPVHRGDVLVIYLTGLGQVSPFVENGMPSPSDPLAKTIASPTVAIGSVQLQVQFSGLAPGQVGLYQINVQVPANTPLGLGLPLTISQGGITNTVNVRVVN